MSSCQSHLRYQVNLISIIIVSKFKIVCLNDLTFELFSVILCYRLLPSRYLSINLAQNFLILIRFLIILPTVAVIPVR